MVVSNHTASTDTLLPDFRSPAAVRHRARRKLTDIITRHLMSIGGISVILVIVLIAFYLLYVVLPMFMPAGISRQGVYSIPGDGAGTLHYAMEEQHEIGLRVTGTGDAVFFKTGTGERVNRFILNPGNPVAPAAFTTGDPGQSLLALGYADGTVLLARHEYQVTYPDNKRMIAPLISYPLGDEPLQITGDGSGIVNLAAQWDGEQATIAVLSGNQELWLGSLTSEVSLLTGEITITRTDSRIPLGQPVSHMVIDIDQQEMYLADVKGFISYYDISNRSSPRLVQRIHAVPEDTKITSLEFLGGGISILVGDEQGHITQWFPVRDESNNYTLGRIRQFSSQQAPITSIAPEYHRKGFLAIDTDSRLGIYHSTAHRTVALEKISDALITQVAIAPRANAMLLEKNTGETEYWLIDNPHPEISWQSLWGKVWYESRSGPEYIWQSSSASSDFEPKFSLTPLAFGTLKAAFYAMLIAVPLAIMGAIYTAYFMAARLRNTIKPAIEVMAALPTVVLGFIAGLWFAPFVESHLPGIFLLVILLPAAVLVTAWMWEQFPVAVRKCVPEGWEAAMLVPVILLVVALCIGFSQPLELMLFDGKMPQWLSEQFGISYDQRNSLVVGVAIGFAVIPIIFSISEDAIYGVPKALTTGSLALGATPWQTMARVILLTASPGIFSAVMIGFGRAVGETMIVVMATGNTAIMDMNIFQGFRALSANIAVEMPEAEVASTHYRILFLAGLVLFVVTFIFNTVAELVRQRLRTRYSTL
jgi:phosphate transport system permease protein